jgi:hypothetical protein
MRFRTDRSKPLFEFLLIDFSEIEQHPQTLQSILNKKLDGIIVRNVFDPTTVATVARRLDEDSLDRRAFPMFRGQADAPYTVGHAIVNSDVDLTDYFRDAALQDSRLARLFAGQTSYRDRIAEVFSALSGGLPAISPLGPEGQPYTPSTVRVLTEGHEIGVHVGNGFARLPQARHLSSLIDMTDQISFFTPFSVSEGGGELVVYGMEYSDLSALMPTNTSADVSNVWLEGSKIAQVFNDMDATAFAPGPGDMLIFDGGRYFHRVSKIQGQVPRRTIGGFLGFSLDHQRLYYWS